jgi:hypothetical protein
MSFCNFLRVQNLNCRKCWQELQSNCGSGFRRLADKLGATLAKSTQRRQQGMSWAAVRRFGLDLAPKPCFSRIGTEISATKSLKPFMLKPIDSSPGFCFFWLKCHLDHSPWRNQNHAARAVES